MTTTSSTLAGPAAGNRERVSTSPLAPAPTAGFTSWHGPARGNQLHFAEAELPRLSPAPQGSVAVPGSLQKGQT
jgi:hypothetical protein